MINDAFIKLCKEADARKGNNKFLPSASFKQLSSSSIPVLMVSQPNTLEALHAMQFQPLLKV